MKQFIRMRPIGDIYIESRLPDGEGISVTNDLLTKLVKGFTKQTFNYMNEIEGVPFVHRERQLHSLIIPALSRITNMFMVEYPLKRNWSILSPREYNDSHGWVDYWCCYRDIRFFIELKHGLISGRTGHVNSLLQKKWQDAIQQLKVIKDEVNLEKEWSSGVFRIALEVVPVYETINNREPKTLGDADNLLMIHSNLFKDLKPSPNWSAIWQLHHKLAGPHEVTNGSECYPGIIFMARVSKISKM